VPEQYQDIWVNGQCQSAGVRDCEARWKMLTPLLDRYHRPFTVLDLGANLGYFALRILENYPEATVVAVEDGYCDWLMDVVAANNDTDRLIVLRQHLTLDDLHTLGKAEHFDVTLALSVVHHIDGDYDDLLGALRGLGDHLILELPVEREACGQSVVRDVYVPPDAEVLGHAPSHLSDQRRPVVWCSDMKDQLAHAYIGSPFGLAHMRIDSTFDLKQVFFCTRPEHRDWIRGINLRTFLRMGGVKPDRAKLRQLVADAYDPAMAYTDIQEWNVVLSGDAATLIDQQDPRTLDEDDDENMERLLASLACENEAI